MADLPAEHALRRLLTEADCLGDDSRGALVALGWWSPSTDADLPLWYEIGRIVEATKVVADSRRRVLEERAEKERWEAEQRRRAAENDPEFLRREVLRLRDKVAALEAGKAG